MPFKLLKGTEQSFRKIQYPELLLDVYLGVTYIDGIKQTQNSQSVEVTA